MKRTNVVPDYNVTRLPPMCSHKLRLRSDIHHVCHSDPATAQVPVLVRADVLLSGAVTAMVGVIGTINTFVIILDSNAATAAIVVNSDAVL